MLVARLEDEGSWRRPLLEFSNYTIAFDPSGRFPRHAGGYASIFDGESQLIDDWRG
jgi:hypothetical protein